MDKELPSERVRQHSADSIVRDIFLRVEGKFREVRLGKVRGNGLMTTLSFTSIAPANFLRLQFCRERESIVQVMVGLAKKSSRNDSGMQLHD